MGGEVVPFCVRSWVEEGQHEGREGPLPSFPSAGPRLLPPLPGLGTKCEKARRRGWCSQSAAKGRRRGRPKKTASALKDTTTQKNLFGDTGRTSCMQDDQARSRNTLCVFSD
jgi:hypothetical protein